MDMANNCSDCPRPIFNSTTCVWVQKLQKTIKQTPTKKLKIDVACAKLDLIAFLKKIFFLNLGEVMAKKDLTGGCQNKEVNFSTQKSTGTHIYHSLNILIYSGNRENMRKYENMIFLVLII